MYLLYVLVGIFGGVFCGLGMGGGVLIVPLLALLGVGHFTTQAVVLTAFVLVSVLSLVFYFKNGLVETKKVFAIIVPACLFALIFSVISIFVHSAILKKSYGLFLVIISLKNVIKNILSKKNKKSLKKSIKK